MVVGTFQSHCVQLWFDASFEACIHCLALFTAQDIVAGPRGAISGQLISLEVRSPDVPDLTLIDLPGIARVAVGDQPKDIGDQVKLSLVCQSVPRVSSLESSQQTFCEANRINGGDLCSSSGCF